MTDTAAAPAPTAAKEQPPFAAKFAHFLTRTDTDYVTSPLSILADRGIENRLLTNLVEHLPSGAIIAGGFVTAVITEEDNASDIDFFFTSEQAFKDTVAFILKERGKDGETIKDWAYAGYAPKEGTPMDLDNLGDTRFLTFVHPKRPAFQLLRMVWYDSPEHVIDTFDLTCVQLAVDVEGLTFNPVTWIDLSRKRLVLHRMQFPGSTLRRLIKYASRGFYACPGSLVNICKAIQVYKGEPDINDVVYVD